MASCRCWCWGAIEPPGRGAERTRGRPRPPSLSGATTARLGTAAGARAWRARRPATAAGGDRASSPHRAWRRSGATAVLRWRPCLRQTQDWYAARPAVPGRRPSPRADRPRADPVDDRGGRRRSPGPRPRFAGWSECRFLMASRPAGRGLLVRDLQPGRRTSPPPRRRWAWALPRTRRVGLASAPDVERCRPHGLPRRGPAGARRRRGACTGTSGRAGRAAPPASPRRATGLPQKLLRGAPVPHVRWSRPHRARSGPGPGARDGAARRRVRHPAGGELATGPRGRPP